MQTNRKIHLCQQKSTHLHVVPQQSTKIQQISVTNIQEKPVNFPYSTTRASTLAPEIILLTQVPLQKFPFLQKPRIIPCVAFINVRICPNLSAQMKRGGNSTLRQSLLSQFTLQCRQTVPASKRGCQQNVYVLRLRYYSLRTKNKCCHGIVIKNFPFHILLTKLFLYIELK